MVIIITMISKDLIMKINKIINKMVKEMLEIIKVEIDKTNILPNFQAIKKTIINNNKEIKRQFQDLEIKDKTSNMQLKIVLNLFKKVEKEELCMFLKNLNNNNLLNNYKLQMKIKKQLKLKYKLKNNNLNKTNRLNKINNSSSNSPNKNKNLLKKFKFRNKINKKFKQNKTIMKTYIILKANQNNNNKYLKENYMPNYKAFNNMDK